MSFLVSSRRLLIVVRHGAAGSRSRWQLSDEIRPLTSKGKKQADTLAQSYQSVCRRIVSSPYARCVQTVAPLSLVSGTELEEVEYLAEGFDPLHAFRILAEQAALVAPGNAMVACTHGDLMSGFAELLAAQGHGIGRDPIMIQKAGLIEIDLGADEQIRSSRYVPPPAVTPET